MKSNSEAKINIDDCLVLFFGFYNYTKKFTTQKDRGINRQEMDRIKNLIEKEKKRVVENIHNLARGKKEIKRKNSELNRLKKVIGLLGKYKSRFGDRKDIIYLKNKIEVYSDYRKKPKLNFIKKALYVGDIAVKMEDKYKKSKKSVVQEVKKSLHKKKLVLENNLAFELADISKKTKEEFFVPFYVCDKCKNIETYGLIKIKSDSLNISEISYFNNKSLKTIKT